jgi:hypothetical protein
VDKCNLAFEISKKERKEEKQKPSRHISRARITVKIESKKTEKEQKY